MKIGNIMFWTQGTIVRSSNRKTHDQPLEFGFTKYWRILGFEIYEDERECGGTQFRLSFEVLWFYVNAMLFSTQKQTRRFDDNNRKWGFYFMDRVNFVWRWGLKYVSFDLTFVSRVFVRHEILSIDRSRVVFTYRANRDFIDDFEKAERIKQENSVLLDYRYETLRGDVQKVTACVCVERWIRRIKWTPFIVPDECICVSLSEDIGSERGTWKGGVTGCGYSLKRGESAIQCLRRMERERRFDR